MYKGTPAEIGMEIARKEAEYLDKAQRERAASSFYRKKFRRRMEICFSAPCKQITSFLSIAETFFSNLPLTVCAMAMSYVTLGVVWFKFYEENDDSCIPTHFHNLMCTFPEFPGCFQCDGDSQLYRLAVGFHYACSVFSGILVTSVLLKAFVAGRVILDDLENPTNSAPYGLLFMSSVCIFAGRGWIGKFIVVSTAGLHFLLTLWFIYTVKAYNALPDPSWYPNTVGIGYPAVKMWLYYPYAGFFLMVVSLASMVVLLPMSVFRVFTTPKIGAPICWIQMSAPSIVLYTMTIMAQPVSYAAETDMNLAHFKAVHHEWYLPLMHFMFFLCLIGVASSVWGLYTRWDVILKKPFSPAHAAFCFPTLSHANAIQAYRGAINSFSDIPPESSIRKAIYCYWLFLLVTGTCVLFIFTIKFFRRLPKWTQIDVESPEAEPPAPNETHVHEIVTIGDRMHHQNFVSPAVLQANETGALVRRRRGTEDGRGTYVRTRNLTALGFEPMMKWDELKSEIEILLAEVERNPPRERRGWLSVPGIDFGSDFGRGNVGVFDGLLDAISISSSNTDRRRNRSHTEDVNINRPSFLQRGGGGRGHSRQDTSDSDHMYAWG